MECLEYTYKHNGLYRIIMQFLRAYIVAYQ